MWGALVLGRGVGGVRDNSSNGNGRRKWQTVSGGAGGGIQDGGGTGNGRWKERGKSAAAWAVE